MSNCIISKPKISVTYTPVKKVSASYKKVDKLNVTYTPVKKVSTSYKKVDKLTVTMPSSANNRLEVCTTPIELTSSYNADYSNDYGL